MCVGAGHNKTYELESLSWSEAGPEGPYNLAPDVGLDSVQEELLFSKDYSRTEKELSYKIKIRIIFWQKER